MLQKEFAKAEIMKALVCVLVLMLVCSTTGELTSLTAECQIDLPEIYTTGDWIGIQYYEERSRDGNVVLNVLNTIVPKKLENICVTVAHDLFVILCAVHSLQCFTCVGDDCKVGTQCPPSANFCRTEATGTC